MSDVTVQTTSPDDYPEVANLVERAFGGTGEVKLISRLRENNDVLLELVARKNGILTGHILFSRVKITGKNHDAVALAPLAVLPEFQKQGVGSLLIQTAHTKLVAAGETLSLVLGDPAYYGRFGYEHLRAAGFESAYQGKYLQALAFADAPSTGVLQYAPAFGAL
ncbi:MULTISPECIES: GNAT family N-acetyltransferase [unclassified Phyllobacterium]|uniref:GNAT family N-acetyltransferase n=1 Tax=unclassified Phyllobacterium TaxID=2638441 RepID=UPI003012EBF1